MADIGAASAWYVGKLGLQKSSVELDDCENCIALGFSEEEPAFVLGPPSDAPRDELTAMLYASKLKKAREFLMSRGVNVGDIQRETVDYLGATHTGLAGINYWGTIAGGYTTSGGGGAFKLKNGVFTRIIYPGSVATYVSSMSDKGVMVGTYTATNGADQDGFVLANGIYKTLDNPEGSSPT